MEGWGDSNCFIYASMQFSNFKTKQFCRQWRTITQTQKDQDNDRRQQENAISSQSLPNRTAL